MLLLYWRRITKYFLGMMYVLLIVATVIIDSGLLLTFTLAASVHTCVKTSGRCTTQLAKVIINPKVVELTADVFIILLSNVSRGS